MSIELSIVGPFLSRGLICHLVVVVTVFPLASCHLGSFFRTMKTRSDDDAQASRQLASSQPPRQAATKTHRAQAGSHAGRQLQARSHASRQLASTQAGRQGECWRNPINFLAKSLENPDTILAISWENSEKILAEFWQNPRTIPAKSWQNPAESWANPGNILGKAGRVRAKSWKNPDRQTGRTHSRSFP